jgi:hypothetical protein
MTCQSVYPPSAYGPYSDESGWSGPLLCVLTEGHDGDRHWNTGINWADEPRHTCGTFGCYRLAVVLMTKATEWVPGYYCEEHGQDTRLSTGEKGSSAPSQGVTE